MALPEPFTSYLRCHPQVRSGTSSSFKSPSARGEWVRYSSRTTSLQIRELANSYMRTGRYAEAIVTLKKTDELDPSHSATLVSLAQAYWLNGMPDEAIAVASREDARWRQFYTLLAEEKKDEASAVIDAFEELHDQNKIVSYAMASDSDKVISLLEASYRRHYVILPAILNNPVLAPWSSDARIVELRRNVGLER